MRKTLRPTQDLCVIESLDDSLYKQAKGVYWLSELLTELLLAFYYLTPLIVIYAIVFSL